MVPKWPMCQLIGFQIITQIEKKMNSFIIIKSHKIKGEIFLLHIARKFAVAKQLTHIAATRNQCIYYLEERRNEKQNEFVFDFVVFAHFRHSCLLSNTKFRIQFEFIFELMDFSRLIVAAFFNSVNWLNSRKKNSQIIFEWILKKTDLVLYDHFEMHQTEKFHEKHP